MNFLSLFAGGVGIVVDGVDGLLEQLRERGVIG
jgi:hypothetical protein